ncbi:MAG TPA: sulfite exporter TauE/SafE family protein, partial [Gemmataceae bacterium]|nr:sulfite exporter TauE/SafE family protein [Gemmataceae bacterium]
PCHLATLSPCHLFGGGAVTVLEFTLLVWLGALVAGFLGALTGLGGGVVIVPLLALVFGVDLRYAIGASLVSVIATSSGAAAAYVKEGYSNIRLGMFLEIATTFGALSGAFVAVLVAPNLVAVVFGVALLLSAYLSSRPRNEQADPGPPDPLAMRLRLDSTYPTPQGPQPYHVHRVPLGWCLMFVAGILSGLLGIGSGAFKVLAMDQAMRIPFKVSTTTSNFMIGVTAAASAGVYLARGYIDPGLVMPVMLGVLVGSVLGARVLAVAEVKVLRLIFGVVILVLGVEMIYKGVTGNL